MGVLASRPVHEALVHNFEEPRLAQKESTLSRLIAIAVSGSLLALLMMACKRPADAQLIRIGGYQPRFIIIFLDETGSRAQSWSAMRGKAALIASRMKNREAYTVIGIDNHGFDEDDV